MAHIAAANKVRSVTTLRPLIGLSPRRSDHHCLSRPVAALFFICREFVLVRTNRVARVGPTPQILSQSGLFHADNASRNAVNLNGMNFRFE